MKQKKPILTSFRVALLVIFLISCIPYAVNNLEENSIYYAMNTPHKEGMHPEIIEFAKRMGTSSHPPVHETGNLSVTQDKYLEYVKEIEVLDKERQISFTFDDGGYGQDDVYEFSKYGMGEQCSSDYEIYYFNSNCEVTTVLKKKDGISYRQPPSLVNSAELNEEILQVFDEAFQQQDSPLINLQWLYDWLNSERFC